MQGLTELTEDGIEIHTNEIYTALADYIAEAQMEDESFDMRKASQMRWNSALMYIYDNVFKNTDKLRRKPYDDGNLLNGGKSNNNSYDLAIVDKIANIYIKACYEFEKEISLSGFCKLTGISMSAFEGWCGHDGYSNGLKVSKTGIEIHKKILSELEESLSNRLVSGKGNPVGILGILNHIYGWNTQTQGQQATRQALPSSELIRLDLRRDEQKESGEKGK